jgi:ankyrin repeat protein
MQAHDARGFTPLLACAWSKNAAAVAALLDAGASTTAEDPEGSHALHLVTNRQSDTRCAVWRRRARQDQLSHHQ